MKQIIVFAGLSLLVACNPATDNPDKPNIILILADDLGTGDVHCYNPRSEIPTPGMDQIASQGIRFTGAHTNAAVCTPTRYGIITGRYCWRTRLKRGVLNGYGKHLINPDRTTIASLLQKNGYYTACVGKWHLGMDFKIAEQGKVDYSGEIGFSPNVYGFDYFYGIAASLDFPPYIFIENDHFTLPPAGIHPKQDFPRYVREGDKAMDVIDNRSEEKPVFLYFALPSPHKPVWPEPRFTGNTSLGPYGDFVHQTDYIVGRILEKLGKEALEEKTLLIETSDNGSFMYRMDETEKADHLTDETVQGHYPENHEANYKYRGTKADIWEAGHRVPFLVQWPGTIKRGQVKDQTICTTDFLATWPTC
jgi:arylsulfatase A-like enzyme